MDEQLHEEGSHECTYCGSELLMCPGCVGDTRSWDCGTFIGMWHCPECDVECCECGTDLQYEKEVKR